MVLITTVACLLLNQPIYTQTAPQAIYNQLPDNTGRFVTDGTYVTIRCADTTNQISNNKYLTIINGLYLRASGFDRTNIKSIFQLFNHSTNGTLDQVNGTVLIGIQNLVATDPASPTLSLCNLNNNPTTYAATFADSSFGSGETWIIEQYLSPSVYLRASQNNTYLTVRNESWADPTGSTPNGWCWNKDANGPKTTHDSTCQFIIEQYNPMTSTASSVLWAVDTSNNVWFCPGVTDAGLSSGVAWTQIPGTLKNIAQAHNGAVWGVDTTGTIVFRYGVTQTSPSGTSWIPIDNPVGKTVLSVYGGVGGALWAIASDNSIWYRNGITSSAPIGTSWTSVSGSATSLGLGTNGEVWATNSAGVLSFRAGTIPTLATPTTTPTGSSWVTITPPTTTINNQTTSLTISQVSCSKSGYVWAVGSNGSVYFKYSDDPYDAWNLKAGLTSIQSVSYGPTGQVWVLQKATPNILYTLPGITDINPMGGASWTKITGSLSLVQISVGPNQYTALPQAIIPIPDATNGTAAGIALGRADGLSGVTGTTTAIALRDDPSISTNPNNTGPTTGASTVTAPYYNNASIKAIFKTSFQQSYDAAFYAARGGIDGAYDGTNSSSTIVTYKFTSSTTVAGTVISAANLATYQSYYDASFYPARGTKDGQADGSNSTITTKAYKFTTANTTAVNANAYSANYDTAFASARGSTSDYNNGYAAGQPIGTTDGNTVGKAPTSTTTTSGSVNYQNGYTAGYNTGFYAARGTLDGKTDGSNPAVTAANYRFSVTTYPIYKTNYDAAFTSAKTDYTNGSNAGLTAGINDGNTLGKSPVSTTSTGSTTYQTGYTNGYNTNFYSVRGTLDGKTDGANPTVTTANYRFSVTTYPAYKTNYDAAFTSTKNDVTNGTAAGKTAGTTDGNSPNKTISDTTSTGTATYQAAYTAAYDTAFYTARGTLNGTADNNTSTITAPNYKSNNTSYVTAYNIAYYTAARGSIDGAQAGLTATSTPAQSTTNYPAYNTSYNSAATDSYNGKQAGTADTTANKSPITTAPSTAINPTIYMTAYNNAFYTAARGTTDGKNAANATPPGSSTVTGLPSVYTSAYSTAFNTAYYTAARGAIDGSKSTAAPTSNTGFAAYDNAYIAAYNGKKNLTVPAKTFASYSTWNNAWVLPANDTGLISFSAVATNDITVLISQNNSPIAPNPAATTATSYEIVLGGWGNAASSLRRNPGGTAGILTGGIAGGTGSTLWNIARIPVNSTTSPASFTIAIDQYTRTSDQLNIVRITVTGAVDASNNPVTLTYEDIAPTLNAQYFSFTAYDTQIIYSNITVTSLSQNAIDTDRGTTDGTFAVTNASTTLTTAPIATTGSSAYQAAFNTAAANLFYTAAQGTIDGKSAVTSTTTVLPVAIKSTYISATNFTAYQTAFNTAAALAYYTSSRGAIDGTNAVTSTTTVVPVAPTTPSSITSANYAAYQTAFNTSALTAFYTPARGTIDGTNAITSTTTLLPTIPAGTPPAYQTAFNSAASNALLGQLAGSSRGKQDSKAGTAQRNDPSVVGQPDYTSYMSASNQTLYKNYYIAAYNNAYSTETQSFADLNAGTQAGIAQAQSDIGNNMLKQYAITVPPTSDDNSRYVPTPLSIVQNNIQTLTGSNDYKQAFISSYDNEYEMYATVMLLAQNTAGTVNGSSDTTPNPIVTPPNSNNLVQDLTTAYNNAYNTAFFTAAHGTVLGTQAGSTSTTPSGNFTSSTGYTNYDNAYNTAFLQARGTLDGTTDGQNQLASPNYKFTDVNYTTNYDAVFSDTKNGYQAGTNAGTQDVTNKNSFNATAPQEFNGNPTSTIFATAYTLGYANAYYTVQAPLDGQADGAALNSPTYNVSQTQPGFSVYKTAYDSAYKTAHDSAIAQAQADGTADAKADNAANIPERTQPKNPQTSLYNSTYMSAYTTEYGSLATNTTVLHQMQTVGAQLGTSDANASKPKNPVPPASLQTAYNTLQNYKDAFNTAYNNAYDAAQAANQTAADAKAGTAAGQLAGTTDGKNAALGTPVPTTIPAPPAGSPTSSAFINAYQAAYTQAFTAATTQSSAAQNAADAKAGLAAGKLAGTTDGKNAPAGTPVPKVVPAPPAGSPTSTAFMNAYDTAYTSAFSESVKKITPPTKPAPKPVPTGPSKGAAQESAAKALQKLLNKR